MKTRKVRNTGHKDSWGNPIYEDIETFEILKDVNWSDYKPNVHTVTDSGEPDCPVSNFEIVK